MIVYEIVKKLDELLSVRISKMLPTKRKIISFYFHGIFKNEAEMELNIVDPQQRFTLEDFKLFFEFFLDRGYNFIDLNNFSASGLKSSNNILMTFDDGYFSNNLVLPLLNEFGIPAIFYIASDYIQNQKAFWVNALYRNRKRQGISETKIQNEQLFLKRKKHYEIEAYMFNNFGSDVFKIVGDIDRTFTESELIDFAKNKFVLIGNHTKNHVSLTNYNNDEIEEQISVAQNYLTRIIGYSPSSISFPNGDYTNNVAMVADKLGFRYGLTTNQLPNPLPITRMGKNIYLLDRFTIKKTNEYKNRLEYIISDYKILEGYIKLKNKILLKSSKQ